jgi:hypothetical protein
MNRRPTAPARGLAQRCKDGNVSGVPDTEGIRMNVARKAGMVAALVALSAFTGGLPATVSAHHGGAIEWGQEVRGPLAGTATKFAFQFPHV